ncbi:TY5A [Symbiodinium sp. CCMP2456]|nr:TY5A [Symbiodinium sp. CCMP2456]
MAALRVSVKLGKETTDLDFDNAEATLGDLRSKIEQDMSLAKAKQQLICAGRRWQGIAFTDSLTLREAAGAKGLKDVDGVKTIHVMLIPPAPSAGVGDTDEVSRCAAQVGEAREIVAKLPDTKSDEARKAVLLAQDLLVKASTALDNLDLVGAQRERRRDLLKQIEAVEQDIEAKKRT